MKFVTAQYKEKPVHSTREEVQKTERRLRRVEEEKAMCVVQLQKAQQEKWERSLVAALQKRAQEHCGEDIPEEMCLLELGWCMREVIVTYIKYKRCGQKEYHVKENREQGVILNRQR